MSTEHKRFFAGGAGFTVIRDPKFKTNLIRVRFLCGYDPKKAAAYAIIPSLITSCCKDFPDSSVMGRWLNYLYGTSTGYSCRHRGGMFEIAVFVSSILSRYAIDGTDVSLEAANLLRGCIFEPAVENGGFNQREFNIVKLSLLNEIDGELNDKPAYAEAKAAEIAYRGESSAGRWYGSREDVEAMTPQRAYEIYKELLMSARIEISFSGGGDFEKEIELFKNAFESLGETKRICPDYFAPSPLKASAEYVEQKIDAAQANLVMVYKSEISDPDAMLMFSWLYGETPFSKLFMNVRERLGLCYFISSSFAEGKNSLTVISGVSPDKVGEACEEIQKQLDSVVCGDFTDDEVKKTKLALADAYRSIYGSVSSLDNWYFGQLLRDSKASPAERTEYLDKIGRDDIIRAARSLKLDTVYVLTDIDREAD